MAKGSATFRAMYQALASKTAGVFHVSTDYRIAGGVFQPSAATQKRPAVAT